MDDGKLMPVPLPGRPGGIAAAGPAGPVYIVTSELDGCRLCAVEPDGDLRWARRVDGHLGPQVAGDGGVWLAGSSFLAETLPSGEPGRRIDLAARPSRRVGAFLLLPDGFLVAWSTDRKPGRVPAALERLDARGARRWLAELPPPEAEFLRGRIRNFRSRRRTPLLVSGDRVLAGFFEPIGGFGVSYCADLGTGRLVWQTGPGPAGCRAAAGAGRFLLGYQGYGAFETHLFGPDGVVAATWPSHGEPMIGPDGVIRVVELENTMTSRSRLRVLYPDGSMTDGPVLPGYHTVGPVLAADGRLAFWRDSRLQSAGTDLTVATRQALPGHDGVDTMLLLDGGRLAFTLRVGDESTLFLAGSDLPGPADGLWVCTQGNLRANPVVL